MNSWIDFKYACRVLLQKPAFALMTIGIMALGMGLCIYNYSFIYGSMLRDLPFENGDRMRMIMLANEQYIGSYDVDAYVEFSASQSSFELFGFYEPNRVNVSGSGNAVLYDAAKVTPNIFEFTSTYPQQGRVFNEQDLIENAKPVVIISHQLWQNYLGGRSDIIGSEIFVDAVASEIIGVMPEGYKFPVSQYIWLPSKLDLKKRSQQEHVFPYGMLKEGVSDAQATREFTSIYRRLQADNADRDQTSSPEILTFPRMTMQGIDGVLIAMSVAVILVLLLACTNVANLLFSRASERAKETAIRVALGAPARRLVIQMMLESVIICVLGGVVAILLAQVGLEITRVYLATAFPMEMPFYYKYTIDQHILTLSIILILFTALITGLFPAWKVISGDFNQVLRDGTRGAQSRQSGKINKALVILEVAVSCALLTSSAMIAIANNAARHTDYGVDPKNLFTARVGLPETRYPTDEAQTLFFDQLISELNAQPGVQFAVGVNPLPGQGAMYRNIETEDFEKTTSNSYPQSYSAEVMPGALAALDVRLLQGRYPDERDDVNAERVAVVTESFVNSIMPKEANVIGKRIRYVASPDEEPMPWMTIIGVVEHVIQGQPYLPDRTRPSIFTPMAQNQWREMSVVIKGGGDPYEMRRHLDNVLQKMDHNVPSYLVSTYENTLDQNVAGFRFLSSIFNLFAAVALLLAATGIYGVIANAVNLRTHELGIRRAMGASDEGIIVMLMKQGWIQLLVGFAIGLPIAFFMGNSMLALIGYSSLLVYAMYAVVPAAIAAVVMFATYVPAKRAVACEPTVALRHE